MSCIAAHTTPFNWLSKSLGKTSSYAVLRDTRWGRQPRGMKQQQRRCEDALLDVFAIGFLFFSRLRMRFCAFPRSNQNAARRARAVATRLSNLRIDYRDPLGPANITKNGGVRRRTRRRRRSQPKPSHKYIPKANGPTRSCATCRMGKVCERRSSSNWYGGGHSSGRGLQMGAGLICK